MTTERSAVDDERRAFARLARSAIDDLLAWTAPVCGEFGIEPRLPELNGAQRQRATLEQGATLHEAFAASVAETARTYAHPEVSKR